MIKNSERGITLISLVITVIVITILSVTTISAAGQLIRESQLNTFISELNIMQSEVNIWYDQVQRGEEESLSYGVAINSNSTIKEQADNIFSSSESGIRNQSGYRYFSEEYIKETLGIEGVSEDYYINVGERSIISAYGFKHTDDPAEYYYTINQIPNELYNVDYEEKGSSGFGFDVEILNNRDGQADLGITNIGYDGYIEKWDVEYKLEDDLEWKSSDSLEFPVFESGKYQFKIFKNDIVSNIVEKEIIIVNSFVAGPGGKDYVDPNGDVVWIPEGGTVSEKETEDSVEEGLVMIDTNTGNEWVWVEVPRTSTVYPTAGTMVTAFSTTDYTRMEADLNNYTSEYKGQKTGVYIYSDEYRASSGVFTNSTDYTNHKNAVLKSIYEKEGFWVSRYEVGNATVAGVANTPVSGYGATIYININKENSQTKAESMNLEGTTGSLMFGFQWDLILKFMEVRGSISVATLNDDSTTIGNYSGTNSNDTLSGIGTAGEVGNSEILNINDIAGNVWEWTLETCSGANIPAVIRGGDYSYDGSIIPASYRDDHRPAGANGALGFRSVLY